MLIYVNLRKVILVYVRFFYVCLCCVRLVLDRLC